jgi:uncharacterized repeat protein (TIGR01451 family)
MVQFHVLRRIPRRLFSVLAAAAMMLAIVPAVTLLTAAPAGAAVVGGFEIDGNATVETAADWDAVSAAPDVQDNNPENTVLAGDNDTKEDSPPSGWDSSGSPPKKIDFVNVWSYAHNDGTTPYLDIAYSRLGETGTGGFYVELNKKLNVINANGVSVPDRSEGDYRFRIAQHANGDLSLDDVSKWHNGDWAAQQVSGGFDYAVSTGVVNMPGQAGIPAKGLVEFSLDLKALTGLSPSCPEDFGSATIRAYTGESVKNLEDYVAGFPVGAGSTCGELKILKKKNNSDGAALAGATFLIHPNPVPGGSGDLTVTDGGSNDADGSSNGVIDIKPAKPGTYDVTETAPPAGWIADPSTHYVTVAAGGIGTVTVVDKQGSVVWQKNDGSTQAKIAYAGATFALYGPAATKAAVDASTTVAKTIVDNGANDEDPTVGILKVSGLGGGWFRLHETSAPAGFEVDPNDIDFPISYAYPNCILINKPFVDPRIVSKLVVEKLAQDGETRLDGAHFDLYEVGDGDSLAGSCVTGLPADPYAGTGRCEVDDLAWGHSYYWKETIPPPGYNLPEPVTSGNIAITRYDAGTDLGVTTFEDPKTSLTTTATDATVGEEISDSATLGNLNGTVDGTLVFRAYGPFASSADSEAECGAGTLVFESDPIAVTQNGSYGPVSFTPGTAGYYYWVATFSSNNTDNAGTSGGCGDRSEISHVAKQHPTISTSATESVTVGGDISDTATLSGAYSPTGTITFTLFTDSSCKHAVDYSSTQDVVDSSATSAPYPTSAAGTYYWIASYSGDANNDPIAGECGDPGESSVVNPASPDISTSATPSVTVGGDISDTATVTGGYSPTGTVTFVLYSDDECSKVVDGAGSTSDLGQDGTAQSDPYTTTAAGTYYWVATYNGDDNNNKASGGCGDDGEVTVVDKATPSITTSATGEVSVGADIQDTAALHDAYQPGGTISFTLFTDSECADQVDYASEKDVVDGGATSDPYTTAAAGTYYWIASYSGDANNDPVSGSCTDEGETSLVNPATPSITTSADESGTLADGQLEPDPTTAIQDTATLHGDFQAGGTVTFTLYGPTTTNEPDCSGDSVGSSTNPVGDGQAVSDAIAVSAPGYYWWVASYSGDDNNVGTAGECGDDNEVTHVTQPHVGLEKTADPPVTDGGTIVQPGQQIDYTVSIPNSGDADVTDAVVRDTLPAYVVVDESSISDGGLFTAGPDITQSAGTITWVGVDVPVDDTTHLTYTVHVSSDAPQGELLTNLVQLGDLSDTTTHQVAAGDVDLSKSVQTLAGDNVGSFTAGNPHNTLVYTLSGEATGDLVQQNVVVTDYVPGFDPNDATSGKTTYVADSATCSVAGCTVAFDPSTHLLTWSVGSVTPPSTWTMTFKVTIDSPTPGANGAISAETIDNVGFVEADRHVKTPSNKVTTPVTAVLGEKVVRTPPPPQVLPFTGSSLPVPASLYLGGLLIAVGVALAAIRRRETEI